MNWLVIAVDKEFLGLFCGLKKLTDRKYNKIDGGSRMNTRIFNVWNYVFNHEISPLRHIPDVAARHHVLQALALMWALAFSVAIGSYTIFAVSIVGHAVLIAAAAITVATYSTAALRPQIFTRRSSRRQDGEHE